MEPGAAEACDLGEGATEQTNAVNERRIQRLLHGLTLPLPVRRWLWTKEGVYKSFLLNLTREIRNGMIIHIDKMKKEISIPGLLPKNVLNMAPV
jgi:hypothetical protein